MRGLLAFLARSSGAVGREQISALLWEDRADTQARASLRQMLYELTACGNPVVRDRDKLALNRARIVTDIGVALLDPGALSSILTRTGATFAVDIDGISEAFDEWLAMERSKVLDELILAASRLTDRCVAIGDAAAAQQLATTAEILDPTDERLAIAGMKADWAAGDAAAARRRLDRLSLALEKTLGILPSADARLLAHNNTLVVSKKPHPTDDSAMPLMPRAPVTGRSAMAIAAGLTILAGIGAFALDRSASPGVQDIARGRPEAQRLYEDAKALSRLRTRPALARASYLLRRAVRVDPTFAPAWARLSIALWIPSGWQALDDPEAKERLRAEAVAAARRAIALDPKLADGYAAMGLILRDRGDAPAWIEKAGLLAPNDAEILLWLGLSREENSGDLRGALQSYQRAAEIAPGWDRAASALAALQGRLGQVDAAFATVDRFAEAKGNPVDVLRIRARLHAQQGRIAEAWKDNVEVLRLQPLNPGDTMIALGRIAAQLSDSALLSRLEALNANIRPVVAVQADPAFTAMRWQMDSQRWWQGDLAGARATYLVASGKSAELVQLFDHSFGNADRYFEKCPCDLLAVSPPLALALRKVGREAEARSIIERAGKIVINVLWQAGDRDSTTFLVRARIEALHGNADAAVVLLDQAVAHGWRLQYPDYGTDPASDPLFTKLHGRADFEALVDRYRALIADQTAEIRIALPKAWPIIENSARQ